MSGTIHVWNDGETTRTPLDVTSLLSLSWSPDGKLAWITRNALDERSLYLLDVDSGGQPLLLQRGLWISDLIAWSRDGRLAWGELSPGRTFRIVVWQDRQQVTIPVEGFVHSLRWSQDGRLLWIDASRAPIGVMRVWDGRVTQVIDEDVRNLTQPLWSQRGQVVWSTLDVGRWSVHLWDGRETYRVSSEERDALAPAWVERAR